MSTLRPRAPSLAAILAVVLAATVARAQQCGSQAGDATCMNCLCCSRFGYCGDTAAYCGNGCQSQCSGCGPGPTPPSEQDLASIVPRDLFERLLLHRNDAACPARGFYTYDAFLAAAAAFPSFGTTGSTKTWKQEVAAFFGQTSHKTTGGWATAPDGPYSWGYCFKLEQGLPPSYCQPSEWPCAPGKQYYGRGPIQLSWNYNYGPAGRAIGVDLLNNLDLVATDPTVSFKTALWFWMTAQANKPSSHDMITASARTMQQAGCPATASSPTSSTVGLSAVRGRTPGWPTGSGSTSATATSSTSTMGATSTATTRGPSTAGSRRSENGR